MKSKEARYLKSKLTEIFKHFCTLRELGCLASDLYISLRTEELLRAISINAFGNTTRLCLGNEGYLHNKSIEIADYFDNINVDIRLLRDSITYTVFTKLADSFDTIYAKQYNGGNLIPIEIAIFANELITIANETDTDEYLDDLILKSDNVLVNVSGHWYNSSLLGGVEVVDYMHSCKCIDYIYFLALTDTELIITETRKQLFIDKYKVCTTVSIIDTLLNYSHKMEKLINISENLDGEEKNELLIYKLINSISTDISSMHIDKDVDKVLDDIDLCTDMYDVCAYMAKGYNKYDAIALSYLDWLKYFSCLTPNEIHEAVYSGANPSTFDKPKKLNYGWSHYLWGNRYTLNYTTSNILIQRYIKAKLAGVSTTTDEVHLISERVRKKIEGKDD